MSLEQRHRSYEETNNFVLNPKNAVIIRLDGNKFSRFTKHFLKPFDDRIHQSMVSTAKDLLLKFTGAKAVFTVSDEIVMAFPVRLDGDGKINIPYNGRVQKLASLTAGFASTRFNYHLANHLRDTATTQFISDHSGLAHFDARVFNIDPTHWLEKMTDGAERTPDELCGNMELANHIVWRQCDGIRNSKYMFATQYMSHGSLIGLNSHEFLSTLEAEKGVRWDELEPWAKYGTLMLANQPSSVVETRFNTGTELLSMMMMK
jgi:tRNA(His) 5'-end guanylyltransferase